MWYLISMQWWTSWSTYVTFKSSEETSVGTEMHRKNSCIDARHRLTQCQNPTGCLPWDDESVFIVNMNKTNSVCDTQIVGDTQNVPNQFNSHTFPRTSHSATNSPKKYRLSPEAEHRTRSPSASPKLKKRVLIPPKPGQIDNNSLIIPNQYKVCTVNMHHIGQPVPDDDV